MAQRPFRMAAGFVSSHHLRLQQPLEMFGNARPDKLSAIPIPNDDIAQELQVKDRLLDGKRNVLLELGRVVVDVRLGFVCQARQRVNQCIERLCRQVSSVRQ